MVGRSRSFISMSPRATCSASRSNPCSHATGLVFAGIAAPVFPSIAREEHFAQKIHAYTFPRTDRPNSRVKDLVDLVLLIESGRLDHERLKGDLADTFAHRATHPLPPALEPPPDFWRPTFEKMAAECGISPDIARQFESIRAFYAALNL